MRGCWRLCCLSSVLGRGVALAKGMCSRDERAGSVKLGGQSRSEGREREGEEGRGWHSDGRGRRSREGGTSMKGRDGEEEDEEPCWESGDEVEEWCEVWN